MKKFIKYLLVSLILTLTTQVKANANEIDECNEDFTCRIVYPMAAYGGDGVWLD